MRPSSPAVCCKARRRRRHLTPASRATRRQIRRHFTAAYSAAYSAACTAACSAGYSAAYTAAAWWQREGSRPLRERRSSNRWRYL